MAKWQDELQLEVQDLSLPNEFGIDPSLESPIVTFSPLFRPVAVFAQKENPPCGGGKAKHSPKEVQ